MPMIVQENFLLVTRSVSKSYKSFMVNLTGNIELDLVLLEIAYLKKSNLFSLKTILKRNNIPYKFIKF